MISSSLYVVGLQHSGKLLYLLSRQAIDNTALAGVLLDELDDILVDIFRLRTYLIIEVRTVERTLELLGIDHVEVLLDVTAHLVSGRGSQGDDWSLAYLVDNRTDTAVFRSEVMSPL